jgi:phytanoyl-CoA hydroxylase
VIDDRAKRSFEERGYVVARGLFDPEETARLRDHFTQLREAGAYPGMSWASSRARTIR